MGAFFHANRKCFADKSMATFWCLVKTFKPSVYKVMGRVPMELVRALKTNIQTDCCQRLVTLISWLWSRLPCEAVKPLPGSLTHIHKEALLHGRCTLLYIVSTSTLSSKSCAFRAAVYLFVADWFHFIVIADSVAFKLSAFQPLHCILFFLIYLKVAWCWENRKNSFIVFPHDWLCKEVRS